MARTVASTRNSASSRTSAAFRSGMMRNGNFETGSGSQTGSGWIGSEWNWWRVNDSWGTASFDNTTSHSGTQCLKVVKTGTGAFSCNNINDVDLTTLAVHGTKVKPSTSYTISYWYKGDGITAPRFQVHEYSASAWIQTHVNQLQGTETVWTFYSTSFTTGASAINLAVVPIRYNADIGDNGTYSYADDIQLAQTSRSAIA